MYEANTNTILFFALVLAIGTFAWWARKHRITPTSSTAWLKDLSGDSEFSVAGVLRLAAGYILFLVGFATMFEETWTAYWDNRPLFWFSQIGFIAAIILLLLPGKVRWFSIPIALGLFCLITIGVVQEVVEQQPAEAQDTVERKTARRDLGFGMHPIELAPWQSTPRLCTPGRSNTIFLRASTAMTLTFWVTPPGSIEEIPVKQPAGASVPLPPNQCVRVEAAGEPVRLTADVRPL